MGRVKKRIPLEVDGELERALAAGLEVERAKSVRDGQPQSLSRNEYICRLLRRGMSCDIHVQDIHFARVDARTMAEFRGDVGKLVAFFVRVRNAILGRNRYVDKTDAESVQRFVLDDKETQSFLDECRRVLRETDERAWALRGFSLEELDYLKNTLLPAWRSEFADFQQRVLKAKAQAQGDPNNHKIAADIAGLMLTVWRTGILVRLAESSQFEGVDGPK